VDPPVPPADLPYLLQRDVMPNPLEYFRHRHREAAKPPWRSIGNIGDLAMDCFRPRCARRRNDAK
jgi:hypothetical protein